MIITPSAPNLSARRLRRHDFAGVFRAGSDQHRHAARRCGDYRLSHQRFLVVVERQELAGRAERNPCPWHALPDLPINEAPQRFDIPRRRQA